MCIHIHTHTPNMGTELKFLNSNLAQVRHLDLVIPSLLAPSPWREAGLNEVFGV